MKIHMERRGTVFEYECQPMKEGRFRALCLLAGAGIYAGMVSAVAALCGGWGLVIIAVVTFLAIALIND